MIITTIFFNVEVYFFTFSTSYFDILFLLSILNIIFLFHVEVILLIIEKYIENKNIFN